MTHLNRRKLMFDKIITTPLGYILGFIYSFVGNYGWSLIIFTVLIKLVILPLALKQQKSTTKMQQLQPKVEEVKEKYKYDQQKMSEETMKLYKEYGVNPAGGCLPLLIQMPILFGLYRVIYQPLTYMKHLSNEAILKAIGMTDFSKITNLTGSWNKLVTNADNWAIISKFVEKIGIEGDKLSNAQRQLQIVLAETVDKLFINFDFLGINLAEAPSIRKISILWLVPIIATVTTYFSTKITTMMANSDKKKAEKKSEEPVKKARVLSPDQKQTSNSGTDTAESMTKSMSLMMPLMTLWITFTMPATLGLYWIVSNILALLQTVALNGYYKKKLAVEIDIENARLIEKKAEKEAKYGKKKKKKRG